MSHFDQQQPPLGFEEGNPPPPPPQNGITINSDNVIHYGTIAFLSIGICILLYLMITRCKTYWRGRLEDWGRQLAKDE